MGVGLARIPAGCTFKDCGYFGGSGVEGEGDEGVEGGDVVDGGVGFDECIVWAGVVEECGGDGE